MIIRQFACCPKLSWHNILVAVVMTTLIVGITTFIFLITSSRGQSNSLSYSKAEPFRQDGKEGVIVFPFGKELWMNESSLGHCPKNYFSCNSSRNCLILEKRCDSRVDCPQAEDEMNCVCAFRMPSAKFCDKYPDCFDQSDESFCSYCLEGYFNCGDGKCIPRSKVCDTQIDCDNFMDENFCFRLTSDVAIASVDNTDPIDSASSNALRTGFLLRNKNGIWYPVCANPYDYMQNTLASLACVSITANPLTTSRHQYRRFGSEPKELDYIYHYNGRFVLWRGCLTHSGVFVSCDDVRCGINPQQMLPTRSRARIVGGEISKPGAWPWHAAIYKNGTYACGATLLNNRWLVSAAHCFLNHKYNYYEIQLGMQRRRSFTPHQKTYRINKVVVHPKFNIVTLEYDIVMLRTETIVGFDFWIRPICLPHPKRVEHSGSFCTAIGWGDTGETEDDSDDLQEVHVPLTKACRRNLDRWLCAGYVEGGKDACQGDSGGPLMCLSGDGFTWYIAGVISAGTGCARPRTPGMYTRVVYFLDWIKKSMLSRRDDIPPLQTCPGLQCSALGGGNCLRTEKVCDAHVDCYDAFDEANCTIKSVSNFPSISM